MIFNYKNKYYQLLSSILFCSFSLSSYAQIDSSTIDNQPFYKTKVFKKGIIPTVLISSGILSINQFRHTINEKRDKNYPDFENHTDDYIQYAPIAATYLLSAVTKTKNDFINKTMLLLKSELLGAVIVHSFKRGTAIERPDGSNKLSFPSGHTTQAFVAATFMHKELGEESILYSIAAYSMASSVAVLRVMNDKHWVSDVLVGAGVGILSTELIYLTHKYRWGKYKKKQVVIMPSYYQGATGLYLSYIF